MEKISIFPGSFCPFTNGHLSVVKRAADIFGNVTVLVCQNADKKYFLSDEQRLILVKDAIKDIAGTKALLYGGLVADYAKENNGIIVKGLRNANDYIYEADMFEINNDISGAETVFLPCFAKDAHISSSMVREMLKYGKDITKLVPNAMLLKEMISK